jgi:stearoyl-CoA desaturase (delta-9 desaturase)
MYALTCMGIVAGYHRLLAHRSYETTRAIRITLAVLGSMAAEGAPIIWVANHRKHHRKADKEGDPHSPHLQGPGFRGAIKGLWHSHMGWLFDLRLASDPARYAPDLMRDRAMVLISNNFVGLTLLGILLTGTLYGALTGMFWGGVVRIFCLHHVTYSINSVGHYFGRRRFELDDHSRNVAWLALPSFGEGWHNNHHAFPTSARHGLRWWEFDVCALFIRALERLGLAWNVVKISPETQKAKQLQALGDKAHGFGS